LKCKVSKIFSYKAFGFKTLGYKSLVYKALGYKAFGYKTLGYKELGNKSLGYKAAILSFPTFFPPILDYVITNFVPHPYLQNAPVL